MVNITSSQSHKANTQGFTLIELMIVVAIMGVIAAIAYPNYQKSVIKTKGTDMMTTMQSMASTLQAQKTAKGSYANLDSATTTSVIDTCKTGSAIAYDTNINIDTNSDGTNGDWIITAVPKTTGMMKNDGTLTLDFNGIRCRNTACGTNDEWNK